MTQAQVTEEQLAKSNEPAFTDALKEKKTGEQHAATAPAQVRGKEAQALAAAKANAAQQGTAAMQHMAAANKNATAAVTSGQHGAQGSDEAKRAQITGILQKAFDATQKDVEQILSGLDKRVDDAFATGEKKVRDAFTADYKRRMDAYKDKRYSGVMGKARWVKDKFAGLPEEANQIFVIARQGYVAGMRQVISNVADIIGGELTRAKQRIAAGRNQLRAEVAKLPKDLQAIGKQAVGEFAGKFDDLTSSVDAKGTELVDTLASKYTEALKAVDAEIEAEKEKDKGLIAKAMDAVGGVVKTIMQLKDLLLGVLAKAAQAVMAILKDPIGFLGHLVSAVGAGLRNFVNNIGTHLQKGLIGWLLGAMTSAGLQIPAKFDLRGILGMIASLLGLTWAAIRGRIVAKGVPEKAMSAVEAGVPLVGKLQNEGVAGVTEEIKEQVGDLKTNLLGKISEYLIPTVLIAGITWIISLLNPASAFIKACKMIIDFVTFIIDRGAQIIEFVNSVLDAIIAIATGGTGGVPALIEKALAKSVPVLIGALAAILGIGGIADKIKKFFQALSKPVMKAVDWIVGKIVKLGKKIWTKIKSKFGKDKSGKGKEAPGRDPAIRAKVAQDVNARLADGVPAGQVQPAVHEIYRRWQPYGLSMLQVKPAPGAPGKFSIWMAASPVTKIRDTAVDPGNETLRQFMKNGQPYAEFGFEVPRNVVLSGSFKALGQPKGYSETHAVAELHTAKRVIFYPKEKSKTVNGEEENPHAEDGIIDSVTSTWDGMVGQPRPEEKPNAGLPHAVLDVKVTRSPCSRCAPRLDELRDWAKTEKSWGLQVEVKSIGTFHVKEERVSAKGKVTHPQVPDKDGLRILRDFGIKIRVMDANDPAIQKHWKNSRKKAEELELLKQKITFWNGKLADAIKEVENEKKVVVTEGHTNT